MFDTRKEQKIHTIMDYLSANSIFLFNPSYFALFTALPLKSIWYCFSVSSRQSFFRISKKAGTG